MQNKKKFLMNQKGLTFKHESFYRVGKKVVLKLLLLTSNKLSISFNSFKQNGRQLMSLFTLSTAKKRGFIHFFPTNHPPQKLAKKIKSHRV